MDAYIKSINQKLNKLTNITDRNHLDDENLRKLIANTFKVQIQNRDFSYDEDESSGRKKTMKIHQLLTKESLLKLRNEFLNAITEKTPGLNIELFKTAMTRSIGTELDSNQLEELYFKVDVMCNEVVTWREYSNYLLLEMDQREKLYRLEKELLGDNVMVIKTEGRDSIKALLIIPFGDFDTSEAKGGGMASKDADCRYLTCSRDGVMNFWSSNFQTSDTYLLHTFIARGTTLNYWVTAAEVIPDARLLAIATTNFNLYLFHYGNNKEFELNVKIEKFPGTIVCLSYHKEESPNNASFLTWGDEYGGVGVIAFHVNPAKTALGINSKHNINKKYHIQQYHYTDLSNNHILGLEARYIPEVHNRYVCQVRYVPKLHSWLTCSKDTCTALFIGDLVPNLPQKNRIYYSVLHGVTVFEYCEKMNFVITGGCDMLIRLWNPMAKSQKLVGVFRGHASPITHLMLDHKDAYLVSVSETKDILVFDMIDQLCIQKVKQYKLKQLGKKPVTAACINKKSHTVVIASNMRLAVIEGKEDGNARRALTTSSAPITTALYNPLFKQIVTGDWRSQVVVWNAFTGEKLVHYTAHSVHEKGKNIEVDIKVMSFDATYRRLITGHRDGMVKIWNYNVGVLLQELPVPSRFEVTSICCPPGKIFVAGCSNAVLLYIEKKERKDYVALHPPHPDNITQISILPETYLASASADGTLIIYSLKTHLPQFKFNIANIEAQASVDFYLFMTNEPSTQSETPQLSEKGLLSGSKKLMKLFKSSQKGMHKNHIHKQKSMAISSASLHYNYCVEALVFLSTRTITPDTAVLLTCMHNGRIFAWPMSLYGKCLGEFVAAHKENELLHAADVTSNDEFLITGDSLGYIKVWDISHYLNPAVGSCCEDLDNSRSFTWENFSFVRMRHNVRQFARTCPNSTLPMHMKVKCAKLENYSVESPHLINSFKSHVGSIISIKLIKMGSKHLIISSASDMSVRIWSLQGMFFGLLGQKSMWNNPELIFGAVSTDEVFRETKTIGKNQEKRECGEKHVDDTDDEVQVVDYEESEEGFPQRYIRGEARASLGSEGLTSLNMMLDGMIGMDRHSEREQLYSVKSSVVRVTSVESKRYAMAQSQESVPPSMNKPSILSIRVKEHMLDLLDYVKKKQAKTDIPSDLKRVGSYTTLYVLETELNTRGLSRWTKIRHATVWIVNYLRSRKLKAYQSFTLERADPSKVGVYSNNIKDMIEEYLSNKMSREKPTRRSSESLMLKNEQDKRNILMRPLTPLTSEVFGQFYSRNYTHHRPIMPWKLSDELTDRVVVCPYKQLPLATFPVSDPGISIKETFSELGFQTRSRPSESAAKKIPSHIPPGGFQPFTESELLLVRNLKKTGWKLMSDGTLARKKVPLNCSKTHSYLPPSLVLEIQVRDGVRNKGERCFVSKQLKKPTMSE